MAKEKTTTETPIDAADGQLYLLSALVQEEKALDTLQKYLQDKAKVLKTENLGKKTLAFPINKHKELTLLSIFFTAEPAVIPGLEKELRLEEEVERYLVTTWRGDINKEMTSERPRRHTRIEEPANV